MSTETGQIVLKSARLALAVARRFSGTRKNPKPKTLLMANLMDPFTKGYILCSSKAEEDIYKNVFTKACDKYTLRAIEAKGSQAMNLPHRANRVDNGELVYGYHCYVEGKHYMVLEDAEYRYRGVFTDDTITGFVEIDPKTLAMNTTVCDKHGKPIYGSFPNRKVSSGGDRVKYEWHDAEYQDGESYEGEVYFENGAFWLQTTLGGYGSYNIEIIGPACDPTRELSDAETKELFSDFPHHKDSRNGDPACANNPVKGLELKLYPIQGPACDSKKKEETDGVI